MTIESVPKDINENGFSNLPTKIAILMLCAVSEKPLEIETLSWILGKSISLEVLGFLESELLLETQNNDLFLSFRTQNCKTRFIEFISQYYPEISVEQINQILVFNSELYM